MALRGSQFLGFRTNWSRPGSEVIGRWYQPSTVTDEQPGAPGHRSAELITRLETQRLVRVEEP